MFRRFRLTAALALVATTLLGCPDDPTESHDLGWIKNSENASALEVDATSESDWTYVSFEKGVVARPTVPEESLDWDIAFQRYNVKTNGGTSGKGQGAASELGDQELETTTTAQVSNWTVDAVIEDARTDELRSMNGVLSGWYAYHFFKHELVSKYKLYAVRSADGRTALFKIHSYYDDAGTAGKMTVIFRFPVGAEQVEPGTDGGSTDGGSTDGGSTDGGSTEPLADVITQKDGVVFGETNLDARGAKTWARFGTTSLERLTELPADGAWDLSFNDWLLQTNSGTSASGQGGAQLAGTSFDEARLAPESGWKVDDVERIGFGSTQRDESTNAALAGWFTVDTTGSGQSIAPQGQVAWLRTHDGKYAKLQILGYYHPTGEEAIYRLRWAYRPDGGRQF